MPPEGLPSHLEGHRHHRYANRRPHVMTPTQNTREKTAAAFAEYGAATSRFQHRTDLNGPIWNSQAFSPAAPINSNFRRKAGFVAISVAWAMNIAMPEGTTSTTLSRDQRKWWRAISATGTWRDHPSRRMSNIAADPTRMTNPTMWTISTTG